MDFPPLFRAAVALARPFPAFGAFIDAQFLFRILAPRIRERTVRRDLVV